MNWQALAQAVIARRIELGYRTREAFAVASSLSSRLLGDLERGQRDNYDRVTLSRLEHALQWRVGHAMEILRAEATQEDAADAGPFSRRPERVAERASRLLSSDGPLEKNLRWQLADALCSVLDLVDPPLPRHRQQREAEGRAMFEATVAALSERQRESGNDRARLPEGPVPHEPQFRFDDVGTSVKE